MKLFKIVAAATLLAGPALAQQSGMGMGNGNMAGMAGSKMMMNDPSNPYSSAEMDMHMKMMAAKQGDASEMWTRKMIEHHRGAIAMSKVALREAKDAETRQMAAMNITMQENDITKLQGWLRKHGKSAQ
jgi:uncharacterized protein (DUF305 family)